MKKTKRIMSTVLALAMCFSAMPVAAFAAPGYVDSTADADTTQEQTKADQDGIVGGDNSVNVYATIASNYSIQIPKTIIIDAAQKTAAYKVIAKGDIAANEYLHITAPTSFDLLSGQGKDSVAASISHTDPQWDYAALSIKEDNTLVGSNMVGSITAEDLTAGTWSGSFNFGIELTNERIIPDVKISRTMQVNAVHDLGVNYTKGEYRAYSNGNIVTTEENLAGSDFVPITNYDTNLQTTHVGQICVYDSDKNYLRGSWDPASITLDPSAGDAYVTFNVATEDNGTPMITNRLLLTRNLKGSIPAGLTFEIFGDSHSAMKGTIVDDNAAFYYGNGESAMGDEYPSSIMSADDMWFSKFEDETGMTMIRNNSYSGYTVSKARPDYSLIPLMEARFEDNSLETPDMFFIYAGTNDVSYELGEAKYSDWSEDDLTKFAPALCYMFDYIQKNAPDTEIVFMSGKHLTVHNPQFGKVAKEICQHYNIKIVELYDLACSSAEASHPSVADMEKIKDRLLWNMLEVYDMY